jgi:hypothetical protein
VVRQAVVARPGAMRPIAFRRALAIARRAIEREAAATLGLEETAIASLSSESVVYKGLFIGRVLCVTGFRARRSWRESDGAFDTTRVHGGRRQRRRSETVAIELQPSASFAAMECSPGAADMARVGS